MTTPPPTHDPRQRLMENYGTAMLGTTRASIWLHDRRARELTLKASSDPHAVEAADRVRTDDPHHPAARGLRLERAQRLDEGIPTVIAPIRGWRRALGTLVIEED